MTEIIIPKEDETSHGRETQTEKESTEKSNVQTEFMLWQTSFAWLVSMRI